MRTYTAVLTEDGNVRIAGADANILLKNHGHMTTIENSIFTAATVTRFDKLATV
jgi:hypothetical protein